MEHPFSEEKQWLEALQSADEKGFEKIYNAYWPKLFSVVYNHVRTKEVAQEIVQEVFVSLWVNKHKLQIDTSLKGYLFQAVRNKIYDYLDRQSVRAKYEGFVVSQKSDPSNFTEQQVAYTDLHNLLHEEIKKLPETTQQVFQLSRFQGSSAPEIAEQMQVSVKTVEYHLTKALKHLRLRLGELLAFLSVLDYFV